MPQSQYLLVFRTDVQMHALVSLPVRDRPGVGDLAAQAILFSCLGSQGQQLDRLCKLSDDILTGLDLVSYTAC